MWWKRYSLETEQVFCLHKITQKVILRPVSFSKPVWAWQLVIFMNLIAGGHVSATHRHAVFPQIAPVLPLICLFLRCGYCFLRALSARSLHQLVHTITWIKSISKAIVKCCCFCVMNWVFKGSSFYFMLSTWAANHVLAWKSLFLETSRHIYEIEVVLWSASFLQASYELKYIMMCLMTPAHVSYFNTAGVDEAGSVSNTHLERSPLET